MQYAYLISGSQILMSSYWIMNDRLMTRQITRIQFVVRARVPDTDRPGSDAN